MNTEPWGHKMTHRIFTIVLIVILAHVQSCDSGSSTDHSSPFDSKSNETGRNRQLINEENSGDHFNAFCERLVEFLEDGEERIGDDYGEFEYDVLRTESTVKPFKAVLTIPFKSQYDNINEIGTILLEFSSSKDHWVLENMNFSGKSYFRTGGQVFEMEWNPFALEENIPPSVKIVQK